MLKRFSRLRHLMQLTAMALTLIIDAARFCRLCLRPRAALAAENLFLRKQLAMYQERHGKPPRATPAIRMAMVWLAHGFDWRHALAVFKPETFLRWHRQGFRWFWRRQSTPGRPPIPAQLQVLIRHMARDNQSWGQERIANELWLKLGLRVSPRTVRKYIPKRVDRGPGRRVPSQRWRTFVRNHAQAMVACDFCVVITATFRTLYVFVVSEHASRRLLHVNVTAHPTALWTLQQLCDAIPPDHRLLQEREWHYNAGRPHMSLGPGMPQSPTSLSVPQHRHRHRLPAHLHVVARPILGGVHHEYWLEEKVA